MRKKAFVSLVALLVFASFLLSAVPGLNSAEKRPSKLDPSAFLKKPVLMLTSFLPIFSSIFDTNDSVKNSPNSSKGKVKPTGDLSVPRPSGGD